MNILEAKKEHVSAIVEMLREFAEFEKLDKFFEVTEQRLSTALFGETKVAEALVAMDGDKFAGYAIFYPSFASFRGQRGFYLEDIYVRKEFRGHGLGEKMLSEIARIARERGFERIDFAVLDWNEGAMRFYRKRGAVCDADDLHFKFTDDAFNRL
ncbi:MAG TPA: GNAT family N-acetyltransferase [Pyrinomonadaceae bacterium]|nr:GNAT family N-acetyltransferase [Pyrinomonadaceae bacterium]